MTKSFYQKYRYTLVDGVPFFETRYYAQKFVDDNFFSLLKFGDPVICETRSGFTIHLVKDVLFRFESCYMSREGEA